LHYATVGLRGGGSATWVGVRIVNAPLRHKLGVYLSLLVWPR